MPGTNSRNTEVLGLVSDVSENSPIITEVGEKQIAVFYHNDEYYALDNTCPHQGGPIGEGKVEDECVYCPWHGWQFDIETGKHEHEKGELDTYEVKVEDGKIYALI